MPHPKACDRVKKGAEFLDLRHPGWFHKICLTSFNFESARDDVLGQLYGNFWTGCGRHGLSFRSAEFLGFSTISSIGHETRSVEAQLLDKAWKMEIQARRKPHVVHEGLNGSKPVMHDQIHQGKRNTTSADDH